MCYCCEFKLSCWILTILHINSLPWLCFALLRFSGPLSLNTCPKRGAPPERRYLPCSRNINHYPTQTSPEYKSSKQLLPDPTLPESYHISYFTSVLANTKYTHANCGNKISVKVDIQRSLPSSARLLRPLYILRRTNRKHNNENEQLHIWIFKPFLEGYKYRLWFII